jgi:NAD-reducing hydrogenase small subunit
MAKPKVSSEWLAACAGCHMSLLDIDERIVQIVEAVDIRATPITDLKHPDKDGVTVGILTGAVNMTTHEEVCKRMRERCQILISMGDCAVFGGVVAQRNMAGEVVALERAYIQTESTDSEGKIPSDPELGRPTKVRPVHEVVDVDIYLPGCPPDADAIFYTLAELANGRIPEIKGDKLHWH